MKEHVSYLALDALLEGFDGQPAEFLDRLAADWPAHPAFLLHLVHFAGQADPLPQVAATGLIKRYLAAGAPFPESTTTALLDLLPQVVRWEARLHLLQMLPELAIPTARAAALDEFLRHCLATEKNRFVRAWVYSGLHRLATLHTSYRPEITALLKRAASEEGASVRARLRRLPAWKEQ